jgi:hypothetical protein
MWRSGQLRGVELLAGAPYGATQGVSWGQADGHHGVSRRVMATGHVTIVGCLRNY